jgi:hypothetical protein
MAWTKRRSNQLLNYLHFSHLLLACSRVSSVRGPSIIRSGARMDGTESVCKWPQLNSFMPRQSRVSVGALWLPFVRACVEWCMRREKFVAREDVGLRRLLDDDHVMGSRLVHAGLSWLGDFLCWPVLKWVSFWWFKLVESFFCWFMVTSCWFMQIWVGSVIFFIGSYFYSMVHAGPTLRLLNKPKKITGPCRPTPNLSHFTFTFQKSYRDLWSKVQTASNNHSAISFTISLASLSRIIAISTFLEP